ncbi:hypothetical protein GGI07_002810 [Coemansia sp. Benny D115]|nr:hypothetical protein GGI07_002810 [Coemansia sp. Benny D115]
MAAEGIPVVVAASTIEPVKPAEAVETKPTLSADAAESLVNQVKHYFGDANLTHDEYMRNAVASDDGWVPMATLARFNRLRELMGIQVPKRFDKKQKMRPKNVDQKYVDLLTETLASGIASDDLLEVKEDKSALRRKEAFVPSDEWFARTVHVKGLPYGKEPVDMIEAMTKFFAQHGKIELVRLRRNPRTKAFKGNVLVQFGTVDEAQSVLEKQLEYEGDKLELALLSAYHDEKKAADEFLQPELQKPGETYPTFEEYCVAHGREVPAAPAKKEKKEAITEANVEVDIPLNTLLKFSGAGEGAELTIDALRAAFKELGAVRFVEYTAGDAEGIIRFREAEVPAIMEANPEGVTVGETKLSLSALTEEELSAFGERAKASIIASAQEKKSGNGGHRGGRKGGRGGFKRSGNQRSGGSQHQAKRFKS